MTADAIGWAIYGWAEAGEWLLLPLGLAAGWGLYRLLAWLARRAAAKRAERDAHWQHLIDEARRRDAAAIAADNEHRPGTNTQLLNQAEAIWNTRTEDQT